MVLWYVYITQAYYGWLKAVVYKFVWWMKHLLKIGMLYLYHVERCKLGFV